MGPFVEGTAQLKGAVATAGAATEQELRFAFEDTTAADSLHENWTARNKAMTALLRYAQSLDAIAAAGRSGAESAGEVAASVQGLAEAAGIVIPGSAEALAVATDAAKFIYGQLATIRAAHQLAEALDDAQPAIERIAEVLRKDLADLDVVAQASDAATAVNLADEYNKLNSDRKSILLAMKALNPGQARGPGRVRNAHGASRLHRAAIRRLSEGAAGGRGPPQRRSGGDRRHGAGAGRVGRRPCQPRVRRAEQAARERPIPHGLGDRTAGTCEEDA
ncbi:MAG: hypothetical protein ACHQ1G_03430 [Planctomycetota bacterium]